MGLDRTFEILGSAPPELAREAYLAAVREDHSAILEHAVDGLLRLGDDEAHQRILERFHALPPGLQERVLSEAKRFVKRIPELAKRPEESLRATAVRFAAVAADLDLAQLAAQLLVGSAESRRAAGAYFEVLARRLAPGKPDRALLSALQSALASHEKHREKAVLRCLLELGPEAQEALLAILAGPGGERRADLVEVLKSQDTDGVAALVLRLARSRDAGSRQAARDACAGKSGKFGRAVLAHLCRLPTHERGLLASRTLELPWWGSLRPELPFLKPEEIERLYSFVDEGEVQPEELSAALSDLFDWGGPQVRLHVVRRAVRGKRPESLPLLARALKEEQDAVQCMAIDALSEMGPPELPRLLVPLINSPYAEVRHKVSRALSRQSFGRFLKRFDSLDPATRELAGRAISKIDESMVDRLADELQSMDSTRRLKALQVLEIVGKEKEVEKHLYDLFRDQDRKIRATVIKTIGLLGTVESMKILLQALSDPDRRIRANAIEAFEDIGNPRFCEILLPFLNDPDNRVRGNACKALWLLGRRDDVNRALDAMLGAGDELMRLSGVWAVIEIEHPETAEILGELARDDPSEKVRAKALEALGAERHG